MIHEAVGHGLESDLSGKKLSVYSGRIGQKVASELITVLDDYVSLTTVKDGKKTVQSGTQDKGWKAEMVAFAESIRSGGEAPISYDQLIGVTKSTFAAVESIQKGTSISI